MSHGRSVLLSEAQLRFSPVVFDAVSSVVVDDSGQVVDPSLERRRRESGTPNTQAARRVGLLMGGPTVKATEIVRESGDDRIQGQGGGACSVTGTGNAPPGREGFG